MEQANVKYALPDTIAKFRPDDGGDDEEQPHVRVGLVQMQNWRLCAYYADKVIPVDLGPIRLGLFTDHDGLKNWNQVKLAHLDRLIRRGSPGDDSQQQDAAEFTRRMLIRFESLEQQIRLQHSNSDAFEKDSRWNDSRKMLQQLLLDSAFVLEQLLQHWEAGTRAITVMRPGRHRIELVQFCNQIPYTLLQELMHAVKLPTTVALPEKCGGSRDNFLMRIAIGYIVGEEASEWLLTKYKGPVHHLLHLVHLHMASAVEQRPLVGPPPRGSSSSFPWPACCKAFYHAAKNKAARRFHGVTTEPWFRQETAWWSYSMLPPACDLNRVGIRFRPPKKATRCLADARFREGDTDGVLELPPLVVDGFEGLLLLNLVTLELEWEWDSSQRIFLSYMVFMSNLIRSEHDTNLLQAAGVFVLKLTNTVSDSNVFWLSLKIMAELNNGHELHTHFVRLARQVKGSYDRLNRAAPCTTNSCFPK